MVANPVPGGTPTVYIFKLYQKKHTQFNSSLVETPSPDMDRLDKGDNQNVYCWCASRNGDGKHFFSKPVVIKSHVYGGD